MFMYFSAQHDYEAERRLREEKIGNLEQQAGSLKAQQATTEHDLENFRAAVTKLKGDERQLQYVHVLVGGGRCHQTQGT
jgi:chromosome segregation ATPase